MNDTTNVYIPDIGKMISVWNKNKTKQNMFIFKTWICHSFMDNCYHNSYTSRQRIDMCKKIVRKNALENQQDELQEQCNSWASLHKRKSLEITKQFLQLETSLRWSWVFIVAQ